MASTTTQLKPPRQSAKVACAFSLVLVFMTGMAAGALGMYYGASKFMRPMPFYTEAGRTAALKKFKTELDLTPQQAAEVETILNDYVLHYRNLLDDGNVRMKAILNPDQQVKLEKLRREIPR